MDGAATEPATGAMATPAAVTVVTATQVAGITAVVTVVTATQDTVVLEAWDSVEVDLSSARDSATDVLRVTPKISSRMISSW